ncbi:unnamed protein product [Symbiodinium natans]|uniref:Uncharacterized protein n=1 Tax=Symbiodinium natans TaxID=878477 RepID=A0A812I3H8_9DINO|nr:unnamed protein product [Symbiodinium natans]
MRPQRSFNGRRWQILVLSVLACRHALLAAPPLRTFSSIQRRAEGGDANRKEEKRGYQFGDLFINKLTGKDKYEFGDLSKFVGGKLQEAVGNFTGKDSYEFGDITRSLDAKAKAEVCKVTGKDVYELGDLSKYLDAQAKQQVAELTGKPSYEFGDISREIARRVQDSEVVDEEDLRLLLQTVVAIGVGLTPVAHLLPVQVILNLYTSSVEFELGNRAVSKLTGALAQELDRRAKGVLLGQGNENYVLGDLTKAQIQRSVSSLTGKDSYEFGDISRALVRCLHSK